MISTESSAWKGGLTATQWGLKTVQRSNVSADLLATAFDFFFWFSRFESALKENGYLRSHRSGAKAEPGWSEFEERWRNSYVVSEEARWLVSHAPNMQRVGEGDSLTWAPVELSDCGSDLSIVIRLVKTVRNNLFHGGKHGSGGWDDPKRARELMLASTAIIRQLAELANLEADYLEQY